MSFPPKDNTLLPPKQGVSIPSKGHTTIPTKIAKPQHTQPKADLEVMKILEGGGLGGGAGFATGRIHISSAAAATHAGCQLSLSGDRRQLICRQTGAAVGCGGPLSHACVQNQDRVMFVEFPESSLKALVCLSRELSVRTDSEHRHCSCIQYA